MNTRKIIEPFCNPAMGILPLLLFMIVSYFFSISTAFLIGAATYAMCFCFSLLFFRTLPPYTSILTGLVIILYFSTSLISPFSEIYPHDTIIFCELIFIALVAVLRLLKSYIAGKLKEKEKKIGKVSVHVRFDEFVFVSTLLQHAMIIHLLIVLLYELLPISYHTVQANDAVIAGLSFIVLFAVIIYESIRITILRKKIHAEDWLPVVNETGNVTGKIAFSVSQNSKRVFLHPIIRIALIYKGLLYLSERSSHYVIDPNKIDYPFEKFVLYDEKLEDAVENTISKRTEDKNLPVKFVFRYLYKNKLSNRLIYLYTCRIDNEEVLNNLCAKGGKLWTEKQIEENLGKGIFSECFEKEYEILRETVLMVEKMMQDSEMTP